MSSWKLRNALFVALFCFAPTVMADPSTVYDDQFDWIKLVSGEWLKGDIQGLRDDSLSFDSDKLEEQKLDWADVAEVHSPRDQTYVLEDLSQHVGRATITPDTLTIQTEQGSVTVPRAQLMAIVSGKPSELNWWSSRLNFGGSFNAGNTKSANLNTSVRVRREDAYTRSEVGYDGAYGTASGAENQNRHEGEIRCDVFLSRRFFLTPGVANFTYDKFKNIGFRAIPVAGVGYTWLKNKWVDWDILGAVGYQYLSYISVNPGAENPQNDMAVKLGTHAEFDITDDVDFNIDWNSVIVATEVGLTNHKGIADLVVDLTDILNISLTFTYTRLEQPAQRADGTTPKSDDFQLVFSVGANFGYY